MNQSTLRQTRSPTAIILLAVIVILLVAAWAWREVHQSMKRHASRTAAIVPHDYHHETRASLFEVLQGRSDIAMLGDSITEGGEWGELLPRLRIRNRGIAGDTTAGALERLSTVTKLKPAIVLVMLGINDINTRVSPAGIWQNYKDIIDTLRQAGAYVMVQSTLYMRAPQEPDKAQQIRELNTSLQAYCITGACEFIDINRELAPEGNLLPDLTFDGLHLNGNAYIKWAHHIAPVVEKRFKIIARQPSH